MLQKDLEPKENKDQAADKLSFALVSASEEVSNNNSGDGDDHGCDTDDGDRFYDRSSEESKCDSDSECVNTGCDSKNKHIFVVDWCVHDIDNFLFVPFPDCFDHHFAADEAKQDECDPVVNACDIFLELAAEKPADKRHQCLKSAEVKPDDECLFLVQLSHTEPLTDRNCKSIHRKPHT